MRGRVLGVEVYLISRYSLLSLAFALIGSHVEEAMRNCCGRSEIGVGSALTRGRHEVTVE